jgi:hypothetical protein
MHQMQDALGACWPAEPTEAKMLYVRALEPTVWRRSLFNLFSLQPDLHCTDILWEAPRKKLSWCRV